MRSLKLVRLVFFSSMFCSVLFAVGPSKLTVQIDDGYTCTISNPDSMRSGAEDEYCTNTFICHKGSKEDEVITSTVNVGKDRPCPASVEEFAQKERDAKSTEGIFSGDVPREKEKANSTGACTLNPPNLSKIFRAGLVEYYVGKELIRFCALSATCKDPKTSNKRSGVIGCLPTDRWTKEWKVDEKGEKKLVSLPVCQNLDDCVASKFTSTPGLLTAEVPRKNNNNYEGLALEMRNPGKGLRGAQSMPNVESHNLGNFY